MNEQQAQRKNAEGLAAFQAGKYELAIRLFNEAINLNPYYPAIWLNRSEAYRKLGMIAEADTDKNNWLALKIGDKKPIIVSEKQERIEFRDPDTILGVTPKARSSTSRNRVVASIWVGVGGAILGVVWSILLLEFVPENVNGYFFLVVPLLSLISGFFSCFLLSLVYIKFMITRSLLKAPNWGLIFGSVSGGLSSIIVAIAVFLFTSAEKGVYEVFVMIIFCGVISGFLSAIVISNNFDKQLPKLTNKEE